VKKNLANIYFDINTNYINEFFGSVLELPDFIQVYSIDKNFNLVLFNENYKIHIKENFGIEIKKGDCLTDLFKQFHDISKEKKILENAFQGNEFSQVGNFKIENEIYYYKDIYKPVKNAEGEVIGVTVFYTDITSKKRNQIVLEVLLNISEKANEYENLNEFIGFIRKELSKLLDTTNFFVALYDSNSGKYSFPFFVDEFDEIDTLMKYDLSRSATDYVRRTGRPLFINREISQKLVAENKIEIIGTASPSWIGLPLITEKGTIGVLVAQNYKREEDIHSKYLEIMEFVSDHIAQAVERKQSEDKMKKIANELQYAQAIAKLGRCEIDLENSSVKMSHEAKKIFGFDEEIENFTLSDIKKTILGDSKAIYLKLLKPQNNLEVNELNFKIVNIKTQSVVYVNTKSKLNFDNSNNKSKKLVVMIQDITQQERDKLELKLAKEKSELADKLKSAFLANMSHEIRTPMNAILGFSKLLVQEHLPKDKRETYAGYINSSGNNLMQLINDIIDVAKIEAGQLTIDKSFFSVNRLLDELYATTDYQRTSLKKFDIDLSLNIPEGNDIELFSDSERLKQIMINLIGNAIKFTEKGRIEFGYMLNNNDEIIFYVQDTGPGIPKEKEDIIFSRFGQIIDNEIIHPGGTGLGLSITKNLVELLGGNIYMDSIIGKGAKFSFNIPLVYKNIEKQEINKIRIDEKQPSKSKILLVEDNLQNRTLVQDIISGNTSHKLEFAETGEEAKKMFLENEYDLIFMDIKLPDIDGNEVTKFIRKKEKPGNRIPIIALSAHAMLEMQDKAFEAGVDEFISKPFIFEQFMQILNHYLTINEETKNLKKIQMKESSFKYIDLSILAPLYVSKPEKLKFIVEQYAKTITENLLKLKTFIDQKETDKLKVSAHSLKSSFAYLGLNNASEIAKEIEVNNQDLSHADKKFKEANIIWEQAVVEIEQYLKNE
jgi:signal transduction histidine kinase/CheY-like chemotaxis protein/HPt (histidine-containing phosphotransfer) domain-containing protein